MPNALLKDMVTTISLVVTTDVRILWRKPSGDLQGDASEIEEYTSLGTTKTRYDLNRHLHLDTEQWPNNAQYNSGEQTSDHFTNQRSEGRLWW